MEKLKLTDQEMEQIQKEQELIFKYFTKKKAQLDKIFNKYNYEIIFHMLAEKIKK